MISWSLISYWLCSNTSSFLVSQHSVDVHFGSLSPIARIISCPCLLFGSGFRSSSFSPSLSPALDPLVLGIQLVAVAWRVLGACGQAQGHFPFTAGTLLSPSLVPKRFFLFYPARISAASFGPLRPVLGACRKLLDWCAPTPECAAQGAACVCLYVFSALNAF